MTDRTAPARPLESFFGLAARGTDLRTEVVAGATTFMTMAYILFVNPTILGKVTDVAGTQLRTPALLTSTALVAAAATLAMGLLANLPLALAAGMGLNSVVAFQLVAGMKLTWSQAMGVVVAEGVIISALVASGLRQAVVRAVPVSMKKAIGIGIGLFLAIIGFVDAGLVSRNAADPVPVVLGTGGHLRGFPIVLFALTFLFSGLLVLRNVRGALLVGIVTSTVVAVAAKLALGDAAGFKPWEVVLPSSPFALPDFSQLGRFDFGFVRVLGGATAALTVFSLMLSDFFDTVGTVVAVGQEARYVDAEGNYPRPGTVLMIDSLAEATGAILVLVGFFMMRDVGSLPWGDATEAIPSSLVLTVMPFTYSITNGIGAGFISWVVLKVLSGRGREVRPLMTVAAVAFVVYFAIA